MTKGGEDNGGVALNAKNIYSASTGESKLKVQDGLVFYEDGNDVYCMGIESFDFLSPAFELQLPDKFNGKNYEICAFAFAGNNMIKSIKFGAGITSMQMACFNSCNNLTTLDIPGSLGVIPNSAFSSCASLKTVTIGEGITTFGNSVFYNCTNLESISFPSTVEDLGISILTHCDNIKAIHYNGTVDQWNNVKKVRMCLKDYPYEGEEGVEITGYTIYCTNGNIEK